MTSCPQKICFFYYFTIFANIALIIFALFIFSASYSSDKYTILPLAIPPLLSIIALRKGGDKEERALKKRIRKAHLRKELDDLKVYDTDA